VIRHRHNELAELTVANDKRDEENQETLALTLRGLRAEAAQTTIEIDRLNVQNTDLKRQLAMTSVTTRAVQTASQSAETSARTLREELSRVKTLLAQVRQQCATDVRKRDLQLQKLRTHLASHQRGSNRVGVVASSITITGGGGSSGRSKMQLGASREKEREAGPSVQDIEYSLTQETTEFLTQLSQSLSDENDALIGLVRGTLTTLKDLMGMPHNQSRVIRGGSQHGNSVSEESEGQDNPVRVLPTSIELLGTDLEGPLTKLRDLLTNPSFAPVEEVHVRDEEIQRLREGWEMIEGRWREAVEMMQGWRKRMLESGDTVNLDDLKMGLDLGEGMEQLDGPVEGDEQPMVECTEEEANDDHHENQDEDEETATTHFADLDLSDQTTGQKIKESLPLSADDHLPQILKEVNGNANGNTTNTSFKPFPPPTYSKVSFKSPVALDNTRTLSSPSEGTGDVSLDERSLSSPPLPKPTPSLQKRLRLRTAASTSSLRTRPSQPRLTVMEKLQRAEAEARRRGAEGRDRSTPIAAGKQTPWRVSPSVEQPSESSPLVLNSPHVCVGSPDRKLRTGTVRKGAAAAMSPVKRTGMSGKPQRRRKSTLSPDELAALMGLLAQDDDNQEEVRSVRESE